MTRKIKNFESLAVTPLRKKALEILESGLKAIDTAFVINQNIKFKNNLLKIKNKKFNLKNFQNVYLVAVGKCALEGALALEKILKDKLKEGIVLAVNNDQPAKKIQTKLKIYFGSHPFPSQVNFQVSLKILKLVSALKQDDFIIFLISGGGSTLLSLPPSFKIQDLILEKKLLQALFKKGATIKEINIIRKHLSLLRGGFLSYLSYPARGVALVFSDVPQDDLKIISSGPTVLDSSTKKDAQKVIQKYHLEKFLSSLKLIETPKNKKYFSSFKNILLVSVKDALFEMKAQGKKLGFKAIIKNTHLEGEAKKVGKKILKEGEKTKKKTLLLYGGETTVIVKGKGSGGRNQEVALGALEDLKDKNILVLSCASDGVDNGPFAGALCDIITKSKVKSLNLKANDYLNENNSSEFFSKVGDYILTGKTNSNVADILMVIKE